MTSGRSSGAADDPDGDDGGQGSRRRAREVVHGLREGLGTGSLRLYLQPIVDAARDVLGYEALVRWERADRELVLPEAFVPLAEHTGLIVEIDAWILEEVCALLADWARDARTHDLFIAVNASGRQFASEGFAEFVRSTVRRYGVRPERLAFEVTETMAQHDIGLTAETLAALEADGHEVVLDDFGMGYSSLGQFTQLPVQGLKIDRGFVADAAEGRASAVIAAIVGMAHAIGASATAEGVENEEQFACLERLGVDRYQGFLFGRPEPAASAARG
ncbi:MAG: EAL domain-containing protein [Leucobacter sp.]|nr:EAL domain-containing protein [Leucobacter sp.]